jgi:hypothetical protein
VSRRRAASHPLDPQRGDEVARRRFRVLRRSTGEDCPQLQLVWDLP